MLFSPLKIISKNWIPFYFSASDYFTPPCSLILIAYVYTLLATSFFVKAMKEAATIIASAPIMKAMR